LRFRFFDAAPATEPETTEAVSTLGERVKREGVCDFSGGKEVWRRGWSDDEAEVVESIEALRRLVVGAEDGMSVCRRLEV
jgi:hypothetical protein